MLAPTEEKQDIELALISSNCLEPEGIASKKPSSGSANFTYTEPQPKYNKKGIYYALLSVTTTVIGATIWKWNPNLPTYELLTARSVLGCLFSYFLMRQTQAQVSFREIFDRRNIIVGICGALSLVCYSFSLLTLTISEAATICATLGIFNGIFGMIFLKEAYPKSERLLGAVCFVGVILIVKPPFLFGQDKAPQVTTNVAIPRYIAALMCLASTALWSLMQIMLRGKKKATGFAAIFQNNFIMGILCAIFLLVKGDLQPIGFEGYIMASLRATTNLILTWAVIKALEYEKPSVVGIVGYSEIIIAILADIIIFHTLPSFLAMVGMSVIVGSCLFLVNRAA